MIMENQDDNAAITDLIWSWFRTISALVVFVFCLVPNLVLVYMIMSDKAKKTSKKIEKLMTS